MRTNSFFSIFAKGFFYMFSLGRNPISEYGKRLNSKSDSEKIASDWANVGNDLRTVY